MVRTLRTFTVQRGPTRVVFGRGAASQLAAHVEALGVSKVLVVSTPGRRDAAQAATDRLGSLRVGVLATAKEHVPEAVVADAERALERAAADAVLAYGGGSAIGLAKALALGGRVRVVAVPTTYSGSEVTPIYGITRGADKQTGRDERVRPALVVYDPSLTAGLPRDVTLPSLWNAMAHAVEALWAPAIDRATALAAEEAVRLLASSAARLGAEAGADANANEAARDDALEGAYLAGAAFGDVGGGVHHKICHALGGAFGAPHAATHAALLAHVVRFEADHAPEAMRALSRALGAIDPVRALFRLAEATGVLRPLSALGVPRDGLGRVVEAVMRSDVASPRPLDRDALEAMLESAWRGPRARSAAARPLRAPDAHGTQQGLGGTHASEALEGALPRRQNAPRRAPYGLYPELLNGTPFTVKSAENSRVWMYRVRPAFSHAPMTPLGAGAFCAELLDVDPNRTRWRPMPLPPAAASVDFLDGLVTLGGAGDPASGPGYRVHLYAANADMIDRAFSDADGDWLVVPQDGALDCRTELGWLRVPSGSVLLLPRALKFAIGLPEGKARGWALEVFGRRLRLPERGPIGSNGLADARHFEAPVASFEDRLVDGGFQIVHKTGGRLFAATQAHSPFDVVAWHGNHAPLRYDLSLFNAMGSVTWDHPDPSILTVLTAPLDDHGRAIADFVVFPGRWEVVEHSFRPPFMHRNAASEVNMVIRTPSPENGYDPGCTFLSPLLTSHGVSTATYDAIASLPDDHEDPPRRLPDASLWAMFESSLPFRTTAWARSTPLVDRGFLTLFEGARSRFDPNRR